MVRTARKGNAAIILLLLVAAGGGALAMSPDIAQDVLPPSILPVLPQFEKVETSRSCGIIERGTELWNSLPTDDVTEDEARTLFCYDKCGGEELTVAGTCTTDDENTLNCICRKEETGT